MSSRRVFLRSGGIALVTFGASPAFLLRAARASDGVRRRRTFVVVFQRGACDGLNTLVPWGESAYYDARRTIAISPPRRSSVDTAAMDLDGFFGLHPALEPLLPLWKDGSLAAVPAVGSPDPTRSHFDAQDYMESGTPGRRSTADGWMNRHLQTAPDPGAGALRALSLTPTLPRILQGRAPAVAIDDIGRFGLRPAAGAAVTRGFEGMYGAAIEDALHGAGRDAFEAMETLRRAGSTRPRFTGVPYPRGDLGRSLQQIAHLVRSDLGVEIAFVETGGWDHHAAEGGATGQLANRLRDLGRALAAFHRDLGRRVEDVVLVTLTEFGRTVRENGNRGTDHGHGSVSLVMGGPVRGGRVHGRWPGLRPADLFEGRDLAVTTDFRDLLAEVLTRHLGAGDLRSVFPGHPASEGRFPGVLPA